MKTMLRRNLKLFFRDRTAVFFSLLAVFIIVGLYAVFLGDAWLSGGMKQLDAPERLMDSWLVAGILAVASVTTTVGAFGIMIEDRAKKISKDFNASPIKIGSILSGYLGSSFLIAMIMSLITAALAQFYIVARGGELLTAAGYVKVFLLILLTALMNTSIIGFVVSFFKSQNAYSTASTIISTMIGFLTGIYLPIGTLPESVQTVVRLFPVSHAAALFRQVLMEAPMQTAFAGVPGHFLEEFKANMGVTFSLGGHQITTAISIVILIGTTIVFYGLSLFNMSRKRR